MTHTRARRTAHLRRPPAPRLLALGAALAVALLLGVAAAQSAYFPQQIGLSWTYSNGETQTFSGTRDLGDGPAVVLTHFLDGQPISEDYLRFPADGGVISVGTASGGSAVTYTPPLQVYAAAPLAVGDLWRSTTEVRGIRITLVSEVVAIRGVRTGAGTFNALQIRQRTLTDSGADTAIDLFFVPSVGVVRYVTQDGTVIDLIDKNF